MSMISRFQMRSFKNILIGLLIVFLSATLTSAARAALEQNNLSIEACPSDDVSTPTFNPNSVATSAVRQEWSEEHFSNPAKHNLKKFRYLVHAMSYMHSPHESFMFITNNVANNPCAALSMSVIDQNNIGTFGRVGFILKVPIENILLAQPHDMGSVMLSDNQHASVFNWVLNDEFNEWGRLETPSAIINKTHFKNIFQIRPYNEVLVEGLNKESIKIVGLFINKKTGRYPADMNYYKDFELEARTLAKEQRLPLVELDDAGNSK